MRKKRIQKSTYMLWFYSYKVEKEAERKGRQGSSYHGWGPRGGRCFCKVVIVLFLSEFWLHDMLTLECYRTIHNLYSCLYTSTKLKIYQTKNTSTKMKNQDETKFQHPFQIKWGIFIHLCFIFCTPANGDYKIKSVFSFLILLY